MYNTIKFPHFSPLSQIVSVLLVSRYCQFFSVYLIGMTEDEPSISQVPRFSFPAIMKKGRPHLWASRAFSFLQSTYKSTIESLQYKDHCRIKIYCS